jgi:hypothetical protein
MKGIVPAETKMATDVQTPPCGGPESGVVRQSRVSPCVIHLTDSRADRKNADDFHSSKTAYPRLPKDLLGY